MASSVVETNCCIVGGGPAGMMLGYLLARQGVQVTVLEKHPDFFRDFRGDTVHPSTLEVLAELDLLDDFLKIPHQQVRTVGLVLGNTRLTVADFRCVPTRCKYVALMPQWDFLDFLAGRAKKLPAFQLLMNHEVVDLLEDGGRIAGVTARTGGQEVGHDVQIRAHLVVGCDGRHSVTRQRAGLDLTEHGVPIDVLWFRISRQPTDPAEVLGNVNYGKALILINREEYFQAGLIIRKGSYPQIQALGIDAFRASITQIAPWLGDRVNELRGWDQIKILTVQINRLQRWHRPGLLCIGDAAHAMSPAGGVGINLAIQDSVAAANLLADPLRHGRIADADLAAVEKRRVFPARITQAVQVAAHQGFARVFATSGPMHAPWQIKAALGIPGVQRALGYAVGVGARPEHVREPLPAHHPAANRTKILCAAAGIAAGAAVCGWATWKLCSRISRCRSRQSTANLRSAPHSAS